ncbi:MAG: calcium-binding protein [Methylorubrum rhodinum]|uniref:calcium-binding protein n=1 Tax=Methylorubrum rhodinum TaxID=29428 RepID=UPI003BAFA41F
MFSYDTIALPKEVVFDAKLFGSNNINLTGNKLDNKLTGNNVLDGSLGADTMSGGAGNDTYIVDNVGDGVVESSNKGTDSVVASVSYALSANVEALRLTGAKAINATGNALANHLIGNGAANVLDGKAGADVMEGGAGNDTYLVDHRADRIVEAFGAGTDTLVSTVSYALAAGQAVETLHFAKTVGTAALDLAGNEFANTLIGSAGDNVLNGGGGADALYGGSGNDTYVVDNLNDKVSEAKGAGTDAVLSSVGYALKGGQEIESLQLLASTGSAALNLTGNEFAQTLRGNAGANVLNGGLGNDVLTGGKGADTFAFSTALGSTHVDRITDFAAEDTIRLAKGIVAAIAPGQLADGAFKSVAAISTAKLDADDRILYKQTTGELFYDADGSGTTAAVKFAVLDNKAALTHADFLIA